MAVAAKVVNEFEVHPYVQFMMDCYNPYRRWLQREAVPIIEDSLVADITQVEFADWERKGGRAPS